MALRTSPLATIETSVLLQQIDPCNDQFGADSRPLASVFDWLETAMVQTESAQTRRLIEDVLGDVRSLGSIDSELVELVLGALVSVDVVLEIERAGRTNS